MLERPPFPIPPISTLESELDPYVITKGSPTDFSLNVQLVDLKKVVAVAPYVAFLAIAAGGGNEAIIPNRLPEVLVAGTFFWETGRSVAGILKQPQNIAVALLDGACAAAVMAAVAEITFTNQTAFINNKIVFYDVPMSILVLRAIGRKALQFIR